MKYLLTAITILVLILALVVGDSFWVYSVCDRLGAYAEQLSDTEEDFASEENLAALEATISYWEKNELFLDLSMNEEALERTKEYLLGASECAENGAFSDYELQKRLFASWVGKMRESADLSLGKIF